MRRTFIRVLALAVAAHSVAAAAEKIQLAGYTGVQMVRGPQNHLLLPAQVNGHAANLLVDTGSDVSFLQADRAKAFGVRVTAGAVRSAGRSFPSGTIDDLRAGNTPLGPMEVAVYEPAEFRGAVPGSGGKPADGVLGVESLRRNGAVINCRTRELFLRSASASRLNLTATTGSMGFKKIPVTSDRGGFLTVPCRVGGRTGRLALDTGAFLTAFDNAAVRSLALSATPSPLTARGLDGRVRNVQLVQVDDLAIGGAVIAPQKFVAMDIFDARKPTRTFTGINRIEYYAARQPSREGPIFGLLGNELLDQRRAIIDLGTMTLFLK